MRQRQAAEYINPGRRSTFARDFSAISSIFHDLNYQARTDEHPDKRRTSPTQPPTQISLRFGLQHWWLGLGYGMLDLTVATRVIRRPEWLRSYFKPLPSRFSPRLASDQVSYEIAAAQIISSYRSIRLRDHQATFLSLQDSMWSAFLQSEYSVLRNLVEEGDTGSLARYLSTVFRSETVDGLFLSFNQEAFSPWRGIPQVHVPSVISRYPRFRRLSRNTSWVRRAYVEEIYASSGAGLVE